MSSNKKCHCVYLYCIIIHMLQQIFRCSLLMHLVFYYREMQGEDHWQRHHTSSRGAREVRRGWVWAWRPCSERNRSPRWCFAEKWMVFGRTCDCSGVSVHSTDSSGWRLEITYLNNSAHMEQGRSFAGWRDDPKEKQNTDIWRCFAYKNVNKLLDEGRGLR